jgi:hypothetical protein
VAAGAVDRRWWEERRASLVKELLLWPEDLLHVEFEVDVSVWEGIEAVRVVVVEVLSVVEMYISVSTYA